MQHCIIYSLLILIGCTNSNTGSNHDVQARIDEMEKMAFSKARLDPDSSLLLYQKLIDAYKPSGMRSKIALAYLNRSNIYDEVLADYELAKINADQSLDVWTEINDSLQMANLLKYIGYLESKLGNFESGKQLIEKAIEFYTLLQNDNGFAVSHFNMARLESARENYKLAEYHYLLSLNHWKNVGNQSRISITQEFGKELEGKLRDFNNVDTLNE